MTNPSARPTDDIEKTMAKYADMLYRLCCLILKNESDAEDAVQETILKLYQKSPSFQNHKSSTPTNIGFGYYWAYILHMKEKE